MHGIPTDEPRHLLADPGALARALVELAFDPAPLPALAARSVALAETLRERSMAAFEEVRRRIAGGDTERVCIVAPVQALDPSCLLHDHLRAVLQRLGRTGHAVLYLVGPAAGLRSAAVARLDRKTRIFVTPSLADGAPDWWTPVDLVDLLAARGMVRAYFLASPDRLPPFWAGTLDRVLIRADLLAAAGQGPRGLVQSLLGQARLGMVGWDARRLRCWAGGTIEIIQAGFGGEAIEPASRHPVPPVRSPADQRLVVLGDPADIVTASLAAIGRALGRAVEVIDPRLDAVRPWLWRGLLPPGEGGRPVALTQARLIADLSENDELAALIRDCAARRGVATVRFLRGERAIAAFPAAPVSEPGSVARLMRTVGRALGDDAALAELVEDVRARSAEDPGWQQIEAFLRGSDPVSRSLVPAAG
jgi:hypothetical protein